MCFHFHENSKFCKLSLLQKSSKRFHFRNTFREDFTCCLAHLPLSYTYFRENYMGTNIFKKIFAKKLKFSRKSDKISCNQLFAQKLYLCFTCWWQAMPFCNNKRKSQHLLIFAKFLPRLSRKSSKIWCLHFIIACTLYIMHAHILTSENTNIQFNSFVSFRSKL